MPFVSLRASHEEVLNAAQHLPAGATLIVPEFDWDDYEQLLDVLGEDSHLRVRYDCGRLEILSPSASHERYAWLIDLMVFVFCETRGLECHGFRQTTWKRKSVSKGLEADACYYIRNAEFVRGNNRIDLERDPPPDLAVEIDVTKNSSRKLTIYAALSIPEVWRYDGMTMKFYTLAGGVYSVTASSDALPALAASMVARVIEAGTIGNPMDALKAFREGIQPLSGS